MRTVSPSGETYSKPPRRIDGLGLDFPFVFGASLAALVCSRVFMKSVLYWQLEDAAPQDFRCESVGSPEIGIQLRHLWGPVSWQVPGGGSLRRFPVCSIHSIHAQRRGRPPSTADNYPITPARKRRHGG